MATAELYWICCDKVPVIIPISKFILSRFGAHDCAISVNESAGHSPIVAPKNPYIIECTVNMISPSNNWIEGIIFHNGNKINAHKAYVKSISPYHIRCAWNRPKMSSQKVLL